MDYYVTTTKEKNTMCYICPKCETALQDLITTNVKAKKAFTIWEITQTWVVDKQTWVVNNNLCASRSCHRDLSTRARELFNQHDKVWVGYACYPIPNGPLLFFPVPRYFDVRIGKIATAIKETGFHET